MTPSRQPNPTTNSHTTTRHIYTYSPSYPLTHLATHLLAYLPTYSTKPPTYHPTNPTMTQENVELHGSYHVESHDAGGGVLGSPFRASTQITSTETLQSSNIRSVITRYQI